MISDSQSSMSRLDWMDNLIDNRALTSEKMRLARWMLEHGIEEASVFLAQFDLAEVIPWKCPCG